MLTPADHAKLLTLTKLPVLTPADAQFIRKCMPANSWYDGGSIEWRYPVSDTGHGTPESEKFHHTIRKPRVPRPADPNSTEQQQPWLRDGSSRSTWYQRRAASQHLGPILASLPTWVDKSEGLKLYRALARFAYHHKLSIEGLWGRVCGVLETL